MPGWLVAVIIVGVVMMDSIIVSALLRVMASGYWTPLVRRFPPRPVSEPAVTREFQSFSFGMFNAGCCVHVTTDPDHLHLRPAWLLRTVGMTPMSVPWNEVQPLTPNDPQGGTLVKRRAWPSGRIIKAKLGDLVIRGPEWCLTLGNPPGETPPVAPREVQA